MKIETKYSYNDKVFVFENNKVVQKTVVGIKILTDNFLVGIPSPFIEYLMDEDMFVKGAEKLYDELECFVSKEELLKSL